MSPLEGSAAATLDPARAAADEALRFLAAIVAGPRGERFLPLFERLDAHVETLRGRERLLDRARRLAMGDAHA